ncbi:hypothetical protein ACJJTC_017381 [Scirpophaga incertulas]
MEEEDPIVQEIPVFLSQTLSNKLYVYQYPVRPSKRDWKEVKVVNASIKPKNQLVRVEVGLDTESDKYCPSKGEQIALHTDGAQDAPWQKKEEKKHKYFKSSMMDKIVFESSTPSTETHHYAIAILQDKELHCTSIQGIVQMRPSYSYFDKQEKHKIDKSKADASDDEEKEPEPKQVTVKFARQETDLAKKAREKSFECISQRINDEPWYDVLWKHASTDNSDLERLKLFSVSTSDGSTLALPPRDYVKALVPPPLAEETDGHQTKLLSPQEQIKNLLLRAKLMTFSEIRSLVRTEDGPLSESALLSLLPSCACCVRGLWAARSTDIYTRACPVPPSLMCAARDHVLYLFTQHPYVDRRKVAAVVRLPPPEVLDIISSIAKYNSRTGWELLLPPDIAFENKYADVVNRQNMYWEARQRLFNEMLLSESPPKRQRKKSQRDSVSSETIMSPKTRCNSVTEDESDKKKHKNKSATGSGKRTRNVSSSSQEAT